MTMPGVHGGLQRGQGGGFGHEHGPDTRSDRDRRFIAGSTIPLVSSSLRDLAARHQLDISDSARLFAAVDMSVADAVITAWDSKFEFGLWRPITAIQLADTDGNPDTLPDPGWLPLTRNAAVPRLHQRSHLDRGRSHPRVERNARTRGRPHRREHHRGGQYPPLRVRDSAESGRSRCPGLVGIHFRTADVVGIETGTQVGDWALDNYFQPTR